jgi:septal ring factor EnvC (AmiA/AmiB activator)
MVEKMKLMFEAVMEAANVMSDTTEEHQAFERQWAEMGKNMQSFHLALNSDLDMQNRIVEQWARFQNDLHDLGHNIQNMGRDVERMREVRNSSLRLFPLTLTDYRRLPISPQISRAIIFEPRKHKQT